jgi:hypothetical protein
MSKLSVALAGSLEGDLAIKVGAVLPIVASLLFLALLPVFTKRATKTIGREIVENMKRQGFPADTPIPPSVDPKVVTDEYIVYAIDSVQLIPATLLPILGAVFTIFSTLNPVVTLSVLALTIIVAIALDSWIISTSASDYVSTQRRGYSIATSVAMISNAISVALILSFG